MITERLKKVRQKLLSQDEWSAEEKEALQIIEWMDKMEERLSRPNLNMVLEIKISPSQKQCGACGRTLNKV